MRPGSPRSSGSTREMAELGERVLGHARPGPTPWSACAATRRMHFSTPRRGGGRPPGRRSTGRTRRCPRWFGRLPVAPCVVVPMPAPRGGALDDRLLPAAGDRRRRGPASYYINTASPRRVRATRPRPRLPRSRARPPPPDRDRPGARRPARLPAPPRADRVLRGLGPVHGAAVGRDGPLHAATSTGSGCSRSMPGGRAGSSSTRACMRSAGRRQAAIDYMVAQQRPRREQHRQRGRPVHRRGPARRSPTRPASSRCCACGPRRRPARRPVRHPRVPRRAS